MTHSVTTRRVAILPDAVADQIAAGEVVERPASVVKELVENALDAGARQVRIEVEQGGKTLIEVSDDGIGHGPGRRGARARPPCHQQDLGARPIWSGSRTFGFRGEALPAIASVSRFTLVTSDGDGAGTELSVTGGRVDRVADGGPAARHHRHRARALLQHARRAGNSFARWRARPAPPLGRSRRWRWRIPRSGSSCIVDGTRGSLVPAGQDETSGSAAVWGSDLAGTLVPVQLCRRAPSR